MDVELTTAGVLCIGLALGHATLGLVWVLPGLKTEDLPKTPFGSSRMTASMIHATWHIVTVFVVALGTLLLILAWDDHADPEKLLLRVFSAMWLGVTTVAMWAAVRRVRRARDLIRLPVPVFFVVVAVLLWMASA